MQRCRVLTHALLLSTALDAPAILLHALVDMDPGNESTAPQPHGGVSGGAPAVVAAAPSSGGGSRLAAVAAWLRGAVVDDAYAWGMDVSPSMGVVCGQQRDVQGWASVPALGCFVQAFGLYGARAVADSLSQVCRKRVVKHARV